MIEVALAMAIIAFGMTSILGLFPVAMNAARASIGDNLSSDASERLATHLKSYAEFDSVCFNDLFKDYYRLPNKSDIRNLRTLAKSDFADSNLTDNLDNINKWSKIFCDSFKKPMDDTYLTEADFISALKNKFKYNGKLAFERIDGWKENVQIYRAIDKTLNTDETDPANLVYNRGVYFITHGHENKTLVNSVWKANENTYEFAAMIFVWKTPITCRYSDNNINKENNDPEYTYSGGINLEISWPAEKHYHEREKRYFYIDAIKP